MIFSESGGLGERNLVPQLAKPRGPARGLIGPAAARSARSTRPLRSTSASSRVSKSVFCMNCRVKKPRPGPRSAEEETRPSPRVSSGVVHPSLHASRTSAFAGLSQPAGSVPPNRQVPHSWKEKDAERWFPADTAKGPGEARKENSVQ